MCAQTEVYEIKAGRVKAQGQRVCSDVRSFMCVHWGRSVGRSVQRAQGCRFAWLTQNKEAELIPRLLHVATTPSVC